jgi:hypothetical protein
LAAGEAHRPLGRASPHRPQQSKRVPESVNYFIGAVRLPHTPVIFPRWCLQCLQCTTPIPRAGSASGAGPRCTHTRDRQLQWPVRQKSPSSLPCHQRPSPRAVESSTGRAGSKGTETHATSDEPPPAATSDGECSAAVCGSQEGVTEAATCKHASSVAGSTRCRHAYDPRHAPAVAICAVLPRRARAPAPCCQPCRTAPRLRQP